MSAKLKDKVAVITGAGRGLGRAFALKFAGEGARIFIPDISLERAEDAVREIKAKGGEAAAIETDISSEASTQEMAEKVMAQYGRVDILVNNAAIWYGINAIPWEAWKAEDWNRIFSVNVTGTWLCCKAIAPLMVKQGGGKIVNIASNVARVPAAAFFLPYACSKSAVYTITQSLARALGPSNINVNAVAPGLTVTEASMAQTEIEKIFELATSEQAMPRREQPEDLLGAVLFLASAEADFISGQILYVDGGTVMI
jgi:3-oxoacyl-[acyl-carrier protein] reductase